LDGYSEILEYDPEISQLIFLYTRETSLSTLGGACSVTLKPGIWLKPFCQMGGCGVENEEPNILHANEITFTLFSWGIVAIQPWACSLSSLSTHPFHKGAYKLGQQFGPCTCSGLSMLCILSDSIIMEPPMLS
jgi:hypothetical protein